jgi:acetyl esterase/lipase
MPIMAARRRPRTMTPAVVVLVALLTSCGSSASTTGEQVGVRSPSLTFAYGSGLTEEVYLPAGTGRVPLVVLVPGGSWTTSDPRGLRGLAAALADAGVAAAPIRVRAATDGVVYPTPVEDVLCAVATAVEHVRAGGLVPGPVAVLGHSSGAHLAALAVLAPDDYDPQCSAPAVAPDALVGLSGPYDISRIPDIAGSLLGSGPDDDPAAWASANPMMRVDARPEVPVLLLHGALDETVPVAFTSQFAQALERAGHPTTVETVPHADHQSIYQAGVAAGRVAGWLRGISAGGRR